MTAGRLARADAGKPDRLARHRHGPGRGWLRCLLGSLFAITLVAGCAVPISTTSQNDKNNQNWSGRFALRVLSDPEQSLSAAFTLSGTAQAGTLLLFGPLGNTLAQLRWSEQGGWLERGGQTQTFASAAELLRAATGTEWPLEALFDWLAGRATELPGWQLDLSQHSAGMLSAQRHQPQPALTLRLRLDAGQSPP